MNFVERLVVFSDGEGGMGEIYVSTVIRRRSLNRS